MDDAKLRELALKARTMMQQIRGESLEVSAIRMMLTNLSTEILARLDEKKRLLERIAALREGILNVPSYDFQDYINNIISVDDTARDGK